MSKDWPKNDESLPRNTTIITVERSSNHVAHTEPFRGTTAQIKKEIEKQQKKAGADFEVMEKLPDGH